MAQKHGKPDDLSSEFEYDSEADRTKRKRYDLANSSKDMSTLPSSSSSKPHKLEFLKQRDKVDGNIQRLSRTGLDAYSRHKNLINEYLLCRPGATKLLIRDASRDKTDVDVVRDNSKFLWTDLDSTETWEKRLAKVYYDKLFKEYCIADLGFFRQNKIAMRWRIEKEVIEGIGQFVCGAKRCKSKTDLTSWEVNFGYLEDGIKKNALVKLRLCPSCSEKLNYHHQRKKAQKRKKKSKKRSKKTKYSESDSEETEYINTTEQDVKLETVDPVKEAAAWAKPVELEEEKSRDDEFEDFLADLLL